MLLATKFNCYNIECMQLLTSAMRAIGACLPTQVISIDPCMGAEPVMHAIFIIMVTTVVHAEEEEREQ